MFQERAARAREWIAGVARSFGRPAAIGALILAVAVLALQPLIASAQTQPTVGLGTADSFAVLGGQGVTNTGPSVVNGDLGTFPNPAVTGFPPGTVNGAIHAADAVAQQAQSDLTTAYNDAAGRTPVTVLPPELGGLTLTPGVYNSTSGFQITGTLTLDAQGDPNGVFIFQSATTLITASGSNVSLLGGAQACNVFWQVGSSATLGTNSTFVGNILALTSIQVQTGVTILGRVLARNASVTLDSDVITRATCQAPTPTPTTSPTTSPTASPTRTTPPPGGGGQPPGGAGQSPGGTALPTVFPSGGVGTGGGSTAGMQDVAVLAAGVGLLVAAGAAFVLRRRVMRKGSSS